MGITGSCQRHDSEPGLDFLVRKPKESTTETPLLILLHGVGSNEADLFSFANQLPDNYLVVSARAPYTLGKGSYAWYQLNFSDGKPVINPEQAEQSRDTLIDFIHQLHSNFTFDSTRVYLCGFSQGAIMSYSVALTQPELVKGIALMSGRLLEEIKPRVSESEALKKLAVFMSHGTNDPVLSVDYARSAKQFLEAKGIHPEYHEYPDVHTINQNMLVDLIAWLRKQEP